MTGLSVGYMLVHPEGMGHIHSSPPPKQRNQSHIAKDLPASLAPKQEQRALGRSSIASPHTSRAGEACASLSEDGSPQARWTVEGGAAAAAAAVASTASQTEEAACGSEGGDVGGSMGWEAILPACDARLCLLTSESRAEAWLWLSLARLRLDDALWRAVHTALRGAVPAFANQRSSKFDRLSYLSPFIASLTTHLPT